MCTKDIEIKNSFFDKIAVVDIERIHSAIIGWLLSDECSALEPEQKLELINKLFETNISISNPKIQTINEHRHLDLYIELSDALQPENKNYFIIETKLKSSQNPNQLKYYQSEFPNINHLLFLTLIDERPNSNLWKTKTFNTIMQLLEPYINLDITNADKIILREYYQSLKNLCYTTEQFRCHPDSYPEVFSEGSLSKEDKASKFPSSSNIIKSYIRKNNLETILQKMYFQDILKDCLTHYNFEDYWVSETRGNAEIGFTLKKVPCRGTAINYNIDFAFQNGSCKLAVSLDYNNIEDTSKNIERLGPWVNILNESRGEYGYNHFNKSRTRARMSLSKHIEGWVNMPKSKFTDFIINELETATILAEECSNKYEQIINAI